MEETLSKREKKNRDVISSMFFSAAIVMIFTQLAGVVANIIDGIITSRCLGEDAFSAISLLIPFVGVIILFGAFLSTGSQVVCSGFVGNGNKKEANGIFTITIILGFIISAVFIIACIAIPDLLFKICGVSTDTHPEFYSDMMNYLHGYMLGIPAMILIQILGPFIVMDNDKSLFTISALVLCFSDIIGDLINAFVFHGGVFGMGVATSIAFFMQLLTVLIHFAKKNNYFKLSFSSVKKKFIFDIGKAGSPTFINRLATILRDLFVSRINLSVAIATSAVAARATQNDLNTLMFCIGMGIGKTLLSMTGIYFGVNDKKGLKRLFGYSMKFTIIMSSVVGATLFIVAGLIARLYSDNPDVIALSIFSIRCMALSLVLDATTVVFQHYLQGIQNRKLVNLLNIVERLLIPVATAFILGHFFGSKGVLASIAVGKLILVIFIFIMITIHCRHIPKKIEDYMYLPDNFGGDNNDNIYACIRTVNELVSESKRAESFCIEHGCEKGKAKYMALFVEEMAGNILQHGKARKKDGAFVDYRLSADNGEICLILRDYCAQFDPTAYYNIHNNPKDPFASFGIRIVTQRAKSINYFNAFNSNNIIIHL